VERLELLNKHLAKEIEVQQLRTKIQTEVQDQVQQSQRDYYLREQLKAIQKELGEQDEGQREIEELRQKIEAAGMPEDVKKEALKELRGCRACLPWPPTTRSRATTLSGWRCCRGPRAPARKIDIAARPRRFWTRTTTS
jgi:hypothetical protein